MKRERERQHTREVLNTTQCCQLQMSYSTYNRKMKYDSEALVECYWHEDDQSTPRKTCPVPLWPPQITYRLDCDWNWAVTVRCWWPMAWAMAQPRWAETVHVNSQSATFSCPARGVSMHNLVYCILFEDTYNFEKHNNFVHSACSIPL